MAREDHIISIPGAAKSNAQKLLEKYAPKGSGVTSVNNTTLKRLLEPLRETGKNRNVALESRCVASVDYNLEEQIMTIEFVERGTYEYKDVPLDVYVDFAQAESQGRYFNLYIREQYSNYRIG